MQKKFLICSVLAYSALLILPIALASLLNTQGHVEITRTRNLQFFELEPNNVDVIRYRNLQHFRLEPGDVDVTRFRNLLFFELADVGGFVINITSLVTTNQSGNPKTSFDRGNIAQFNFTIENLGSLTLSMGLISAEVLDSSNTPVFLGYLFADLPSGLNRHFAVGYMTSTDASPGTYTAKIMVFTDWPSQGGIGLDIETTTFDII